MLQIGFVVTVLMSSIGKAMAGTNDLLEITLDLLDRCWVWQLVMLRAFLVVLNCRCIGTLDVFAAFLKHGKYF